MSDQIKMFKAGGRIVESEEQRQRRLEAWAPATPTEVLDTMWRFAAERQEVFFRRACRQPPPWTTDRIISQHKFTNAYRASDRVSQYLIRSVIYSGSSAPDELFFRTLMFKLFNKIETWEMLENQLGAITWEQFSYPQIDQVLTAAMERKVSIYSAAYIMPSGRGFSGARRKHQAHLQLLEMMMEDAVPARLADSNRMMEGFELLRSYPMIGDFLAYQYITDVNYSRLTEYREDEFVVPGPGARDGLNKCFSSTGGLSEVDLICRLTRQQETEFDRLGISFRPLPGRRLQLIDVQNLLCEVAKYARVSHPEFPGLTGRTRIKQKFRPTASRIQYMYPPDWEVGPITEEEPSGT